LLYSSVFVCEIFRGGIAAIGKGQWEAGRALGLGERRTLWMIVLPQAMRIVIPPMTTQYLSIIKNTTLALVVGYPDISMVVATTINQTGQALEGVGILVTVFLGVSLAASIAMTVLNRRMAFASK
jgi:general L-amino acid transport system permease protein